MEGQDLGTTLGLDGDVVDECVVKWTWKRLLEMTEETEYGDEEEEAEGQPETDG